MYPEVSLSIEDVAQGLGQAAIRKRRLDIVFTNETGVATRCRSEVFWRERFFVLLPADHGLAAKLAVTWADLASVRLLVPAGPETTPLVSQRPEHISEHIGPAIQICSTGQATATLKVQLGQEVMLAGESFAKAAAFGSAIWKPLEGKGSFSSIRVVWLESNPKRAVLRLVALATKMANGNPEQAKRAS